jgi:hypothetical protein
MRLLHKDIDRDGVGTVTLLPEELEDMWHAYNLISVGDHVRATTLRYCFFIFFFFFFFFFFLSYPPPPCRTPVPVCMCADASTSNEFFPPCTSPLLRGALRSSSD